METRANHIWVGAVTLLLLALLAGFIVWLAGWGERASQEYDIFFKQSVSGLAKGSEVTYTGVPVGQVTEIELAEADPEFVRVRIKVREDVPVLVGTTATIQASFTGVSAIMLDGARKDAPKITCETTACPEGKPVIPPGRGGLGELVANAPLLLERLATLTERLTLVMSDENQAALAGILQNTNKVSADLAAASPQLAGTIREMENTLREAGETLDAFEKVTNSTDAVINQEGGALAKELRATLASASTALQSLSKTLDSAQPAARTFNEETLPAAQAALEELRETSKALRVVTERIENEGAAGVLGAQPLPDYKPKGK
ncbi:MlaD family protein [Erythrobacter sp. SDW2]|uniref:MlaD family protein n=1 Tax=Erythrobacter sp. SDW2 TaxID=2907154 RepID=UPI001F34285F|nr:MlaD family protein [Erythrobacter sp. SDW2]UIP06578.1 MlaD family protein [Erythrobacter sp. SDW2]